MQSLFHNDQGREDSVKLSMWLVVKRNRWTEGEIIEKKSKGFRHQYSYCVIVTSIVIDSEKKKKKKRRKP